MLVTELTKIPNPDRTDVDQTPPRRERRNAINTRLDDAVELLERELERLKATLETCRRLDHPRRDELVRTLVHRLDERQDALERLHSMLLALRSPDTAIH